jgi:hypothetical protein
MQVFNLKAEQAFDPKKHMERVLGPDDVPRRTEEAVPGCP